VLEKIDCETPHGSSLRVSEENEVCETLITTHADALRALVSKPGCTTAAVERLAALASGGANAPLASDLAAAYYVRARRDDQTSDLLRSFEAAKSAVQLDPALPAARFNLALAQESLGFSAAARESWKRAAQLDHSSWSREAAGRAAEIERAEIRSAATRWTLNWQRLPEAVDLGESAAIKALIQPFPAAAQRYVEDEVLPAWGKAAQEHRAGDARRFLRQADVIASALWKLTGDPYLHEIVRRIQTARGENLRELARGHVAFGDARARERAHDIPPAGAAYSEAVRAFARSNSPLRASAELGNAVHISLITRDKQPYVRKLAELEPEVRKRGYLNLWARVQSNRANLLQIEGDYLASLEFYDAALRVFQRMNDDENLANVHVRKAGIYRVLGHDEAALRETFLARRHAAKLLEIRFRHLLAGETAATALALGFPDVALMYQSAFVDELLNDLANAPDDEKTKQGLRFNLAIALGARAAIRLQLGDRETARIELDQASGISQQQGDEKIRNGLRARIAEVKAEEALPKDPRAAVAGFTEALALSGPIRYRTFQTILLMRRAEAYRLAGMNVQARQDISAAIAELNAEETELLAGRRRGEGEGLWSDYFSRFQESYQLLIERFLEEGNKRSAFSYAERSRAFEPLKLVLDLPSDVQSSGSRSVDIKTLPEIRAELPRGTFILEYQVAEQRTFVWIVSRGDFDEITLPVGRAAIETWIRGLQHEAVDRDAAAFDALLTAPFAALLRAPIERLERMPDGRVPNRRLVIVPHRFMHGFPFSALRDPKTKRHLVQDFPIATAASATLYVLAMERDQKLAALSRVPKALLVGDPAFNRSLELTRGLDRLPYARIEAEDAGKLYAPNATVLLDAQATVPAFLSLSRDSDIIHVAGHAVSNPHAPFGTLLLMAPAANHTGLLYEEELLTKLQLQNTRLVVLSACSSAGGVPVGPEGLAPLVRPIIAAGVPGVVGSLWTINDAASEQLLVEFHRHYREGRDAASALQLAQIRFLNEQNRAIPVFAWSAFQVVGQASSPFAH
jgi:CHAT domain-containing protein